MHLDHHYYFVQILQLPSCIYHLCSARTQQHNPGTTTITKGSNTSLCTQQLRPTLIQIWPSSMSHTPAHPEITLASNVKIIITDPTDYYANNAPQAYEARWSNICCAGTNWQRQNILILILLQLQVSTPNSWHIALQQTGCNNSKQIWGKRSTSSNHEIACTSIMDCAAGVVWTNN